MIRIFLFFIVMFYSAMSAALLPPYYESAREIMTILSDPKITEKITPARVINSIVKTETGYTIIAGECTLIVEVHALPPSSQASQEIAGPANIKIEAGEISCKK